MGVNLSVSSRALTLLSAFVVTLALIGGPARAKAAAAGECGGTLAFGEIAVCASISGDQQNAYTITVPRADDRLYATLTRGNGEFPYALVTAPDGTQVCSIGVDSHTCQLGAAGKYTITVYVTYGGTGNYTLSVQSMRTPPICTTLANQFFSFASTGYTNSLPFGSSGDCFKFNQPVGSVVYLWDPSNSGDVQAEILDGQMQRICTVRYATYCTLASPGPYRLQLFEYYGSPVSYTLRMSRISNAMGCAPLKLAGFGDPGDAVGTGNLPARETITCHRIHMPSAGIIGVHVYKNQEIYWSIYDNAGQIVCQVGYPPANSCHLPAEGNYSLIMVSQSFNPIDFQIAVPALFRNTGCTPGSGLSWALDALTVHQTSPVQTNCQLFQGNAGDRVIAYRAPVVYNDVISWFVDSTGETLCTTYTGEDGCVLPATGQYRVISYAINWDTAVPDAMYKMQIRRLSNPAGCPVIRPGSYGAAPAGALGPIRCRVLDITTPGRYIAKAFDVHNYQTYATLYNSAGNRVCFDSSFCDIPAAGRYTLVLAGGAVSAVLDNDFSYVTALLPYQPSGCAAVTDTGYLDPPSPGEFTSAGQVLCRQLPSPAGSRVVMLQPSDAPQISSLNGYVLDSTGAYVCDVSYSMRQVSCQLAGTAPFFVVLNEFDGTDPGPFTVGFGRVDGPPAGCPVLPRDADGSTVTTGAGRFAVCYTIPADQHAAREIFTWRRLSGSGGANLSVFSDAGARYCSLPVSAERTFNCFMPTGPVTVILEAASTDASYQITHRDGTTP